MSPVAQFEASARATWNSDLGKVAKGRRLKEIQGAIVHYVARMDEKRRAAGTDAWTDRSFDRVRGYLKHLAADVEELALLCERTASTSKPTAATIRA